MQSYILCNKFDSRINLEKTVVSALKAFEEDFNIKTLDSKIKQRVIYKDSMLKGLGVYEATDPKAKTEIIALTNEIQSIIENFN